MPIQTLLKDNLLVVPNADKPTEDKRPQYLKVLERYDTISCSDSTQSGRPLVK